MSARDTIVELEGEDNAATPGDRRRATILAFALCVAIGSAVVGRDGPAATAPGPAETTLIIVSREGTTLTIVSREDVLKLRSAGVIAPDLPPLVRVQLPEGAIVFLRRPSPIDPQIVIHP